MGASTDAGGKVALSPPSSAGRVSDMVVPQTGQARLSSGARVSTADRLMRWPCGQVTDVDMGDSSSGCSRGLTWPHYPPLYVRRKGRATHRLHRNGALWTRHPGGSGEGKCRVQGGSPPTQAYGEKLAAARHGLNDERQE